jgi:streptogramin lyase
MRLAGTRTLAAVICLILATSLSRALAPQQPAPQAPSRYPRIDVAAGYRLDPAWPRKPAEATWAGMSSMAVDAAGNIWTFNRGNIPVQVYRADGTLVRSWGQGAFKNPHQLQIDRDGNVWTADDGNHTVRKFTPDGKLLLTLGAEGQPGDDNAHFNRPTDVVVTPAGDVFISDGYGNNRIVHYDRNGKFVKSWGKLGVAAGELSVPHSIDVDSKGRLYVADRNNVRVQVFDQSGKFLAEWRNVMVPWTIWISPRDEIYICGSSPMQWSETPESAMLGLPPKDQVVMKFDPDGRVREVWVFPRGVNGQEKPGDLNVVHGIAVDASGALYLGDVTGRRAQRFVRVQAGTSQD